VTAKGTDQLCEAFGRPGMPPRWTSSSKEGVGTAYSTSSRVWFTLSHGILNEIYFPTIDHPQTRDMQFLITDGASFFHEERRDLDSLLESIEADSLGYRVTTSDRDHRYRIVKEIVSDPHQSCVLIDARLEGAPECLDKLRVYALLAPHLEVGGYGNSARRFKMAGKNLLIAWKAGKFLAMGANVGFNKTSCGFVGHSDGWQDLYHLDWEFDTAEDGNVAMIGEVNLAEGREFTVGIAFGDSLHAAVTVLQQSLAIPFGRVENRRSGVSLSVAY
jgi:glucoamylase